MRARPVLASSLLAVGLVAGVASAHVSLDKASVPADSDQSLQARVPGENPPATTTKLVLEIPAGFTAKSCASPVGMTCVITKDTGQGRSALITWTRQSGAGAVDLLDFTVHTPDKNGSYPFEANQYYSDGTVIHWDGPADGDHPAPRLEVTGASTKPVSASPPPTHSPVTPDETAAPVAPSAPAAPAASAPASAAPSATATATTAPSASATASATSEPAVAAPSPTGGVLEVTPQASTSEDDGAPVGVVVVAGLLLVGATAGLLRARRKA